MYSCFNRYVKQNSSIDLLNVAFAREDAIEDVKRAQFDTPDRVTGRLGFQALKKLFPSRKWNFVEVNVFHSFFLYKVNFI